MNSRRTFLMTCAAALPAVTAFAAPGARADTNADAKADAPPRRADR